MKEVTIYTTRLCPFCYKAKILLNKLGVSFTEISIDLSPKLWKDMGGKAGKTSVPEIWIGDSHIGGCNDLYAMHYSGTLSEILT